AMSTAIASPRPDSSRPDSPRPASLRLVARLGLARKFALLGAIALVVVGALLALHVRDSLSTLRTVGRELDGLEPSRALLDVVRLAQQHRGLTSTVLGGKADAEPDRAARQAEVDAAMQRFDAIVAREVDDARTREDWSKVSDAWRTLSGAVAGRRIAAADSLARHTALIAAQIELHDRVVDHFGLTLHP
nr:nitrate- and nitrite sensing domain-containing protein [Burkholderiaceae bacterium]